MLGEIAELVRDAAPHLTEENIATGQRKPFPLREGLDFVDTSDREPAVTTEREYDACQRTWLPEGDGGCLDTVVCGTVSVAQTPEAEVARRQEASGLPNLLRETSSLFLDLGGVRIPLTWHEGYNLGDMLLRTANRISADLVIEKHHVPPAWPAASSAGAIEPQRSSRCRPRVARSSWARPSATMPNRAESAQPMA